MKLTNLFTYLSNQIESAQDSITSGAPISLYSDCKIKLIEARMEVREWIRLYLDALQESRKFSREKKKMEAQGISFIYLDYQIKRSQEKAKTFHEQIISSGYWIVQLLDNWQLSGATLKDLCNLCNRRDYEQIKQQVSEHLDVSTAKFSNIMFVFTLDYPRTDKCDFIRMEVDAPFTHAIKEYMLDLVLNTPEGREAGRVALEEVFPELTENALCRNIDDDGTEYFTDKEGNRI